MFENNKEVALYKGFTGICWDLLISLSMNDGAASNSAFQTSGC